VCSSDDGGANCVCVAGAIMLDDKDIDDGGANCV